MHMCATVDFLPRSRSSFKVTLSAVLGTRDFFLGGGGSKNKFVIPDPRGCRYVAGTDNPAVATVTVLSFRT